MRTWLINIILFLSFCAIVFVYYKKDKQKQNNLDNSRKSLQGLKKILPRTGNVEFVGINRDNVTFYEVYLLARYALIPIELSHKAGDTALVVFRIDSDSTSIYIDSTHTILWENKDSAYHYTLVTK
jgi:hypothetical protein